MAIFQQLFQERAGRILALSRVGRIGLEALSQIANDPASKFWPFFKFMAGQLPAHYQKHPQINVPEYRVVAFLDGVTLIATISEVEAYFQDMVVNVLRKHPEKIGKSTIEVRELLKVHSIAEAIDLAAQRMSSDMMFKRPNEYKKDLLSFISADAALIDASWPVFVEAKARRDLGVHNGWMVNDIYQAKIKEVGIPPPSDSALFVDHDYLQSVRSGCLSIMENLEKHCEQTFA